MKTRIWLCPMTIFLIIFLCCAPKNHRMKSDILFQVSTIEALLQGSYQGELSLKELKNEGDFGLGTFHNLDGEMVELNRVVYQVKYNGQVCVVHDSVTTPFSVVTFFNADISEGVESISDLEALKNQIDGLMESQQMIYGVRIDGIFEHVRTRSVQAQQKPYPKLADVIQDQAVFDFENIPGTIVGFWMPASFSGLNVTGYHLHFISEDRSSGGHLLDCAIKEGLIELDKTNLFSLVLPKHFELLNTKLNENEDSGIQGLE